MEINYENVDHVFGSDVIDSVDRKYRGAVPGGECNCRSCIEDRKNAAVGTDFRFYLRAAGPLIWIDAGCRDMTIADYRKHVDTYPKGDQRTKATLKILDRFDRVAAKHLNKQFPSLKITVKPKRVAAKKAKAKK